MLCFFYFQALAQAPSYCVQNVLTTIPNWHATFPLFVFFNAVTISVCKSFMCFLFSLLWLLIYGNVKWKHYCYCIFKAIITVWQTQVVGTSNRCGTWSESWRMKNVVFGKPWDEPTWVFHQKSASWNTDVLRGKSNVWKVNTDMEGKRWMSTGRQWRIWWYISVDDVHRNIHSVCDCIVKNSSYTVTAWTVPGFW